MRDVQPEKRREIIEDVLQKFDRDGDGAVSRGEWMDGWRGGERLKDFGVRGTGRYDVDGYADV